MTAKISISRSRFGVFYSTSRGALYPALAMIWYFTGLPF